MPKYARSRSRYSPYAPKTFNKGSRSRAPAALKSYVKSVVQRSGESKTRCTMNENTELHHNGLTLSGIWSDAVTEGLVRAEIAAVIAADGVAGTTYEPPIWAVQHNMLSTTIGSADGQRIGNKLYAKNLNVRLWLSNKLDRPNVMYRIMVVRGNKNNMAYGPYPMVTGSALQGLPYFWDADGSRKNNILRDVNRAKYHVVYEKLVQPFGGDYSLESSASNKEHSRLINFNIKLNKTITYDENDATYPEGDNVYSMIIIPYDAYGSQPLDNIASCSFRTNFTYTDN